MQRHRYFITDQIGTLAAQPLGASDFSITWSQRQDDALNDYQKEFGGSIKLRGEVYQRLYSLEHSVYRCEPIELVVEKLCNENWEPIFSGIISLNNAEFDEDNCSLTVKFTDQDAAACLTDNDSVEYNLLNIYPKFEMNTRPTGITIETTYYRNDEMYDSTQDKFSPDPYWGGSGTPYEGFWQYYDHSETVNRMDNGGVTTFQRFRDTRWVREILNIPVGQTPDNTWSLISTDGSTDTYARRITLFGVNYENYTSGNTTFYRITYDFLGKDNSNIKLRNGVRLRSVMQLFVDSLCPGLTVKSDFFQIDPDEETNINYVTNEPTKVNNIFVFSASDVKRPTANNVASKLMYDWKTLTETLLFMFNVEYRIVGNYVRFEHVNFWNKAQGLDLTDPEYSKYLVGKRKYKHNIDSIPSQEIWAFGSKQSNGDFNGYPIRYLSGCSVSKSNNKTYTMDRAVTDIELCFANPNSDNKTVDDENIVFVAAGYDGTGYYILQEPGITSETKVNNTLSLAHLHRDYHRYKRFLPSGVMNGAETQFLTVVPTKEGVPIKIPMCCPANFDPDNLIKTPLGTGVVSSAVYNFKDSTVDLTLLYNSFEGLDVGSVPVAVFENVNTYDNSTIIIDVLANDTYQPGDIVEIFQPPALGSASVTADNKISFAVNLNNPSEVFTYLTYRIRNPQYGVYSNAANVNITIRKRNEPPVANPDNYQVVLNTLLTVLASQGVLANDTDDYGGLFVASFDEVSAQGGTVVMQQNGSFTYNPPAGYTGNDSFNYTVQDDGGLQAVGVVNLRINAANVPIAVNDSYKVQLSKTLDIDNSLYKRGLLYNDYTLDSSAFNAVAETKTSNLGATVVIQDDGRFTYSGRPAAGVDSFDYTVQGVGGSSVGSVEINVLPVIKVGLRGTDFKTRRYYINCPDSREGIFEQLDTFELYFLDANNNPIDVTAYGLRVLVQTTQTTGSSQPIEYIDTFDVSGTSLIALPSAVTYHREIDCQGIFTLEYYRSYSVVLADGYSLI